jgi:glycosyltransferase involved in cell wall biosynthesis
MTPLSAVLVTLNEERGLPAALESVAFCEEVVVVDAGSTDRTREVAEAGAARVIVNSPWPGFVAQRAFAVSAARHDWVLALDADERVTPALREEILALRSKGFDADGYRMARVARYLGRWIRGCDWYPDRQLRLFDRRKGGWEGSLIHESVRVRGRVGWLRGELEHHPYASISEHMRKIDHYTTLWAEQSYREGRRASLVQLVGGPVWALFRNFVLKGGFLLGSAGFSVSVLNAHYTHAKLAKLAELWRSNGPPR